MTSSLREQAMRLNADIAATMRQVGNIERRLRAHCADLQRLVDAEELRRAAEPLVHHDRAARPENVVAFERPNRHFDCPEWPQCGCPDGTVHPDCPGIDLPGARVWRGGAHHARVIEDMDNKEGCDDAGSR